MVRAGHREPGQVERGGNKVFVRAQSLAQKEKKIHHTEISDLERFEQTKLPAKLLDYFWGNRSN